MFFPAAQNGSVVSRLRGPPHLSEHPDIAADGDHARARASEDAKRFGLVLPQRFQLGGNFVERLLPPDRLELPFAARADPLQRLSVKRRSLWYICKVCCDFRQTRPWRIGSSSLPVIFTSLSPAK